MKIPVFNFDDRLIQEVELDDTATLGDLKRAFQKARRMSVSRQHFVGKKIDGSLQALNDVVPLQEQLHNVTIHFKDRGPQISWTMVFLIEYFGPMIAFPLVYLLRPYIYFTRDTIITPLNQTQWIAFWCFVMHFVKRELETLFIHKFSKDTMPLRNVFKNSAYYWGYALFVAYFVLRPDYTVPWSVLVFVGLLVFIVSICPWFGIECFTAKRNNNNTKMNKICELCNGYCHWILGNLRSPGSTERKIPRGFLFEFVSCPNYTFEILAWVAFTVMTSSIPALLFTVTGAVQMWFWAVGKHKRYRREFPDYPKHRKILVPFLI